MPSRRQSRFGGVRSIIPQLFGIMYSGQYRRMLSHQVWTAIDARQRTMRQFSFTGLDG